MKAVATKGYGSVPILPKDEERAQPRAATDNLRGFALRCLSRSVEETMTSEDIKRVESALEIKLPSAYTKVMTVFPLPAYAGNTEMLMWDDADALIALNRELRKGRSFVKPWTSRFFALGQDAGGCSDALDLEDPEFGVFWFDRQHVQVGESERSPEKIEAWLTRQVRDLSSDLAGDGIDPTISPEKRKEIEQKEYRSSNVAMLLFLGVIAIAVLVGFWIGIKR